MEYHSNQQHHMVTEDGNECFQPHETNQKQQNTMELSMEMNENNTNPLKSPSPLDFLKYHTGCTQFTLIYDSDENEFNQRAFQSIVVGRKNILGIVITENGDVFGSFHTVHIQPTTNDLNWTKDDDFFVYSILKHHEDNYQIYKKNEGVYCKERSFRMVYDDETFYRINNAFYLRPCLYQKRGKTWDDFGKDYSLIDEKHFFTTRFGFSPIRVLMYQCY